MIDALTSAADAVIHRTVASAPGVPGVVAGITDKDRTVYLRAAGVRRSGGPEPLGVESPVAMMSTTKAVTATAALQLVERGRLDLDAPARRYASDIGVLQVLTGFDEDGEPVLRPPAADITTRQLLTHTAGLGYEFFNADYARLVYEQRQPSINSCTRAALRTPLSFDPGTRWEYGSNVDWVGQVIEGVTGERLGEVLSREVFQPLGITTMSFTLDEARQRKLADMHLRTPDGGIAPLDTGPPPPPEIDAGGHGLYGTVGDYLAFIRMWLNDGMGDRGRVLRPETVREAVRPHLPDGVKVTALRSAIPWVSNDVEFFPGIGKSWSLAFMVNEETAPTGRSAGAQGWAGLANLYYWIDREQGIGGYWATQLLPFMDAASYGGYLEFERVAYDHMT
ncbi:serine hydrolase [Glycomyces sp. NRRL B-16210]|uniref:serine hydrolase domain-containing protein n=1 Tax=Glycomyces sp. NRRL B-16210 TaxID=1463821 RepID=UPI0004C0EE8A|nr:serine hydrolase domain-containing protein [Glycomyces sp. NRRL B-16210]